MRRLSYWLLMIALIYGSLELISYGGLVFLRQQRDIDYRPIDEISSRQRKIIERFLDRKNRYFRFDSTLGWSIQDNGASKLYQANSAGLRGDREYSLSPAPGVRRIAAFGDSYTHCSDVGNQHTWQAFMERLEPGTEVLNFGVDAYGPGQSYLRYLEHGKNYRPHVVLIGFMSENIGRSVNTYRPFYFSRTDLPLAKPRFKIQDGELVLVPNKMTELRDYGSLLERPRKLLSELGANDYYFQKRYASSRLDFSPMVRLAKILRHKRAGKPADGGIMVDGTYNQSSEAFAVTTKILDRFYRASLANGSTPIIVILPNRSDLIRHRRGGIKLYAPLLSYFDSKNYRYVDLTEAFAGEEIDGLFAGHYTPLANRLVAEHLLELLGALTRVDFN